MSLTPEQRAKFNDYSGAGSKCIAIFCWSRTEVGTPLWAEAEKMGRLAAANGYSVVTGGYCGSMEAVSKGAREVVDASDKSTAPVAVRGILVPGQFPDRALVGNRYLTESVDAVNFPRRVEILTAEARYYVILPGTLGTLQELTTIWTLSMIHHSSLPRPLILAFRDPWEKLILSVAEILKLPDDNVKLITFVDDADDCMRAILEDAKRISS